MTSHGPFPEDDLTPVSQQAAHWWVVLHDESCTAEDREAFAAWVKRAPDRVEAFLRQSILSKALKTSDIRWPDVSAAELVRQARSTSAEVIPAFPLARVAQPRRPIFRWSTRMLMSASLATVFLVVLAVWVLIVPSRYETDLGEQRSVLLDDGSIIMLNTSSQIEVKYTKERRFVRLVRGEALFEVARDVARPFDVAVGGALVRAVGTQFNIDLRADRATVTVVEGRVKVMPEDANAQGRAAGTNDPSAEPLTEMIVAAQRVIVTTSGVGEPEQIEDLAPVTAWTQRQLVFENRPLAEVAAEFNRYNHRRIIIESNALQTQQVTGVFQANDPASFLAFISGIPGVRIRANDAGDHIVYLNSAALIETGTQEDTN